MKFSEVAYSDLSSITHKIFVHKRPRYVTSELKIIKFIGSYGHGGAGANDALYIRAACEAAHTAWYSKANILDFTELDYQWGDEMQGVLAFGWDKVIKYQYPLAVVVGDSCRKALQSLFVFANHQTHTSNYQDYCRDTLEEAIELAEQKHIAYKEYLDKWFKERGH
jgi:hypothetical protein